MLTLAEKLAAKRLAAELRAGIDAGLDAMMTPEALPVTLLQRAEPVPESQVETFVRIATPSISVEVTNPPTDRDTARAQFKTMIAKHGYIWNRHTPAECYARLISVNRFIGESEKLVICQGMEARK